MSDKLIREAAERLRSELSVREELQHRIHVKEDRKTLSDAYLAEHPADDSEPITKEWLLCVGFRGDLPTAYGDGIELMAQAVNRCPFDGLEIHQDDQGILAVYRKDLIRRGDVRRLAAALGITLKEAAPCP